MDRLAGIAGTRRSGLISSELNRSEIGWQLCSPVFSPSWAAPHHDDVHSRRLVPFLFAILPPLWAIAEYSCDRNLWKKYPVRFLVARQSMAEQRESKIVGFHFFNKKQKRDIHV